MKATCRSRCCCTDKYNCYVPSIEIQRISDDIEINQGDEGENEEVYEGPRQKLLVAYIYGCRKVPSRR